SRLGAGRRCGWRRSRLREAIVRSRPTAAKELIEELPILCHCPAEGLGVGLALAARDRNRVCTAVVFDDIRVIYGDVVRSLFELSHRVTAVCHDLRNEDIGLTNALDRSIDKARLYTLPLRDVLLPSLLGQGHDAQLLAAFHPTGEVTLGLAAISSRLDGSVVLRAERAVQPT